MQFCVTADGYLILDLWHWILAWRRLYIASVEFPCPNNINRFVHNDGNRKTESLSQSEKKTDLTLIFNWHQGSISSMFHLQLLRSWIPISQKRKKIQLSQKYFLCFRDLWVQKLLRKHWWNWHLVDLDISCLGIFGLDYSIFEYDSKFQSKEGLPF